MVYYCSVCSDPVLYTRVIKTANGSKRLCERCYQRKGSLAKKLRESFHEGFARGIYALELVSINHMVNAERGRVSVRGGFGGSG